MSGTIRNSKILCMVNCKWAVVATQCMYICSQDLSIWSSHLHIINTYKLIKQAVLRVSFSHAKDLSNFHASSLTWTTSTRGTTWLSASISLFLQTGTRCWHSNYGILILIWSHNVMSHFTARCTLVQSAVLWLSVCNVHALWLNRLVGWLVGV